MRNTCTLTNSIAGTPVWDTWIHIKHVWPLICSIQIPQTLKTEVCWTGHESFMASPLERVTIAFCPSKKIHCSILQQNAGRTQQSSAKFNDTKMSACSKCGRWKGKTFEFFCRRWRHSHHNLGNISRVTNSYRCSWIWVRVKLKLWVTHPCRVQLFLPSLG